LNQEEWELDRSSASYAILNPYVSLLAPHLCLSFQSILNMCIGLVQCMQCYRKHGNPTSKLKPLSTTHFRCMRKPCSIYNPRSLAYFGFNHLRVIYLTHLLENPFGWIHWLSWHYMKLLKLYTMFNYSIYIKVTITRVSIIYWPH